MSNQLQQQYDERIAELYKKGVEDINPPEYLDRYVLFEAQRQNQLTFIRRFSKHWSAPASMAAVILLSVILVMNLNQDTDLQSLEEEKHKAAEINKRPVSEDAQLPGASQGILVKETVDQAKKRIKQDQKSPANTTRAESRKPAAEETITSSQAVPVIQRAAPESVTIPPPSPEPAPATEKITEKTPKTGSQKALKQSSGRSSDSAKEQIIEPIVEGQSFTSSIPSPKTEKSAPPVKAQVPVRKTPSSATVTQGTQSASGSPADSVSPQSMATPQYDIPKARIASPPKEEEAKTIIGSALEDPSDPENLLKKQPQSKPSAPVAADVSPSKSEFERQVEKQDSRQLRMIQKEMQGESLLPKPKLMADAQQWFKLIINLYDKPTEQKRYVANVKAFKARYPKFGLDNKMKIIFPNYKPIGK